MRSPLLRLGLLGLLLGAGWIACSAPPGAEEPPDPRVEARELGGFFHLASLKRPFPAAAVLHLAEGAPPVATFAGSWGPVVELGPERPASRNPDGGALRAEPSAALRDGFGVVAWNDSWGGRHGASIGVVVGWASATGPDAPWRFHGYLPAPRRRPVPGGADSRIVFDAAGRFYLLVQSWTERAKRLQVFRGDPERPDVLAELAVAHETEGELIDKPDLEVAEDGTLFVAFRDAIGIAVVRSPDGGSSWSEPMLVSNASSRARSGVAIEARGDRVVAMWTERDGTEEQEVWSARSVDGGRSFEAARRLHRLARPVTPLRGYAMGVGPAAHMASDVGLAVDGGRFYAAFLEPTEEGSFIRLIESVDGGRSWSRPETVGLGGGSPKAFPSLEVVAGRPAVLYYDRRLDRADDTSTDVFLSWRTPDGAWSDIRLTTVSTRWDRTPGDREHAMIQRNFGDYITLAADGSRFLAAWTDGREGEPRIYTRAGRIAERP